MSDPGSGPAAVEHLTHHHELLRECLTMALYVAITLLATLLVLPHGEDVGNQTLDGGISGPRLLGVIWGTTVGLALVHWYAFTIASAEVRGGGQRRTDVELGLAQLAGAGVVAATATLLVLVVDETDELTVAIWAPAILVGVVGYLTGRASDRSRWRSLLTGGAILALGVAVAIAKLVLGGH